MGGRAVTRRCSRWPLTLVHRRLQSPASAIACVQTAECSVPRLQIAVPEPVAGALQIPCTEWIVLSHERSVSGLSSWHRPFGAHVEGLRGRAPRCRECVAECRCRITQQRPHARCRTPLSPACLSWDTSTPSFHLPTPETSAPWRAWATSPTPPAAPTGNRSTGETPRSRAGRRSEQSGIRHAQRL